MPLATLFLTTFERFGKLKNSYEIAEISYITWYKEIKKNIARKNVF